MSSPAESNKAVLNVHVHVDEKAFLQRLARVQATTMTNALRGLIREAMRRAAFVDELAGDGASQR